MPGAETPEIGWVDALMAKLAGRIAAAESRRVRPLYRDDKGILDELREWLDGLPPDSEGLPLCRLVSMYNGPGRNRIAMGKAAAQSQRWRLRGRQPRRLAARRRP